MAVVTPFPFVFVTALDCTPAAWTLLKCYRVCEQRRKPWTLEIRTICQAAPSSNEGRVGHVKHLQLWDSILCFVRVSAEEGGKCKNFQTCSRTFEEGNVTRHCSHTTAPCSYCTCT